MIEQRTTTSGTVYLVGAGPGAPDLITLRGVQCLRQADVVLYDYLVNPEILQHAAPHAEQICLGRHGQSRTWPQEKINQRLVELAQAGKAVVRLKGGDPAIFARGAEEAAVLIQHGIPYEMVPGITAAVAAGSYTGVSITHRDFASAVALVTGHEEASKSDTALDYASLANFPGTLVFYMGVTTAANWSSKLIQAGKSAETPVMIVRRCSLPDQQTIHCTLASVAQRLTDPVRIRPPAIVIVGPVAGVATTKSWFEQRPLFGKTVMVTRPSHQAADLGQRLNELGAQVLYQPAIQISEPEDWSPVDQALAELDQFDWVVFSSANGVEAFLQRLEFVGRDLRAFGGLQLAAIGPATADRLQQNRLKADYQPQTFQAEHLADGLVAGGKGRTFLLVRASRGREVLAQRLAAGGAQVTQVVAYHSSDVTKPSQQAAERLAAGQVDWITVTSSAIARSLVTLFSEQLRAARLVSISPVTSETLRELGYPPAAEARQATMQGVVDAIRHPGPA